MIYKCIKRLVLALMVEFSQTSCGQAKSQGNEVIYHVFQRSFYDSNGDLQGDLSGLAEGGIMISLPGYGIQVWEIF